MADKPPFALWAEAGAAIETLLVAIRGAAAAGSSGARDRAASVLTEAYLIAVASGLRCAGRLAAACDRRRDALAAFILSGKTSAAGPDEPETTAAVQALAIELGDAAVLEARRFQAEMRQLAARLPDAGPPSPPAR